MNTEIFINALNHHIFLCNKSLNTNGFRNIKRDSYDEIGNNVEFNYEMRISYKNVFNLIFDTNMFNKIIPFYSQDYLIYTDIYMKILQSINNKTYKLNNEEILFIESNLSKLSYNTCIYFDKICNVLLDKINIDIEVDFQIIKYIILFRLIPVYHEFVTNCYGIYNNSDRENNIKYLNNIFIKFDNNFKNITINDPEFISIINVINNKHNNDDIVSELIQFTNKHYNNINNENHLL